MYVVEIKRNNYSDKFDIHVIPGCVLEWYAPVAFRNVFMVPGTLAVTD